MSRNVERQTLGRGARQQGEAPRRRPHLIPSHVGSPLSSQGLGPPLPARRAEPRGLTSSSLQRDDMGGGIATPLGQHRVISLSELLEQKKHPPGTQERRHRNRSLLAFLDEWLREPDDMGAEWWDDLDEELAANRFRLPDSELP